MISYFTANRFVRKASYTKYSYWGKNLVTRDTTFLLAPSQVSVLGTSAANSSVLADIYHCQQQCLYVVSSSHL